MIIGCIICQEVAIGSGGVVAGLLIAWGFVSRYVKSRLKRQAKSDCVCECHDETGQNHSNCRK